MKCRINNYILLQTNSIITCDKHVALFGPLTHNYDVIITSVVKLSVKSPNLPSVKKFVPLKQTLIVFFVKLKNIVKKLCIVC